MSVSTETPEAPAPEPAPAPAAAPRPQWSPVPQVNLLPPEILADRRFRRLQRRLAVVTFGVAALCGAGVVWAQAGVTAAESDLAIVVAQGTRLQAQQAKYADVPKRLAELDRVKGARAAALGADVSWYRFLADLAINTPVGTQLETVSITMDGGTVATASSIPLAPAGLGKVVVTGKALNYPDVAAWLEQIIKVNGLQGSVVDTATSVAGGAAPGAGTGSVGDQNEPPADATDGAGSGPDADESSEVSFNGSAVVVPDALSHRYDRKAS